MKGLIDGHVTYITVTSMYFLGIYNAILVDFKAFAQRGFEQLF